METLFRILGLGLCLLVMVVGTLEILTRRRLYPRLGRRYDPRIEGTTSIFSGVYGLTIMAVLSWDLPWWAIFVAWLPLAATSIAMLVRGPLPDQSAEAP